MWGQSWQNIFHLVKPYPDAGDVDITALLKKGMNINDQAVNVLGLYKIAEHFFVSIGLSPMTEQFWENSAFIQRMDNNSNGGPMLDCHATATDMFDAHGRDFRSAIFH